VVSLGLIKADIEISSALDAGSIRSKGSVSRAIGEIGDLRLRLALVLWDSGVVQVKPLIEGIRTIWSDCKKLIEKCD
jgi:hypothetical protein